MNRARDSSETNQYSSVPGHDQPSSGGASEAPRRLCMDQSVACTPSRGVCATGWGAAERHHFEGAAMLSSDKITGRVPACDLMLSPVCSGHCTVVFACSPIRDKCKMNVLSRFRPSWHRTSL